MVYKRFSASCSLYNRQLKKPATERAKHLGELLFFMTGERESTMSSMSTQSVSLKQYQGKIWNKIHSFNVHEKKGFGCCQ